MGYFHETWDRLTHSPMEMHAKRARLPFLVLVLVIGYGLARFYDEPVRRRLRQRVAA